MHTVSHHRVSPFCFSDIVATQYTTIASYTTGKATSLRNIHHVLLRRLAARRRHSELAADLVRDLRVRVSAYDVTQRVLLLRRKVRGIALAEHEQALVPEDGELALRVRIREPYKVEHERVEDLVRQRVLLI
jgi:hypothetical protein